MKSPNVISQHNITGRGLVLVVEDNEEYSIDEIIEYCEDLYQIRGIEQIRFPTSTPKFSDRKGLIVRQLCTRD